MKIKLEDGTVITEKWEHVNGYPCYAYYIGKTFAFGAQDRFDKEMLQRLYNNGYFDIEIKEHSARVKASMKYSEKNVKQIKLALNKNTDADIIEALDRCENVQGYIKSLIRKDLN